MRVIMVDRYISLADAVSRLSLGSVSASTCPSQALVESWITSAEDEIDKVTGTSWDLQTVTNEVISPDCQTNEFILSVRPLKSITKLEYQAGDEWSPSWVIINPSDYRILSENRSKIRTKEYYWMEEGLRITYQAGYEDIPSWLSQLCLLLTHRNYILWQLSVSASETELISVASVRIQDKSKQGLSFVLDGLNKQIQETYKSLKSMKSKNCNIGYIGSVSVLDLNKRYRCY